MTITDEHRSTYEREGVVCVRGAFTPEWLAFLSNAVEEAIASPGPHAEEYVTRGDSGRFFGDIELSLRLSKFRRFMLESPAAEIAGRIMGASRVNFFYDQLLVKEPGTSERTPWHQDQPYWAISGYQVCSVWLPLDPIPEEMSVEYVCGSHRWAEFSPYHFVDGSPYVGTGLPPLPAIEANRHKYKISQFAMQPGDCLVFQALIVHGAPGNTGRHRRRALATRWAGDDARYCQRPGEIAIPTEDPGLLHGQLLDCERFPLVWTAQGGRQTSPS
ncbi:MAG: phytanoyl-CoA dioxygenase family protein [Acidobacteria bacterium]|nr:phytanoyl-CoA dioxygenase family protein [Acidobacteriota bacterium]